MTADSAEKASRETWASAVKTSARFPIVIGILILLVFGGGFGVWAALSPLSGAAVAPGIVAASGQNLVIQHFEGGIVDKILVREGDAVKENQSLIILDKTSAEATRNRLSKLLIALEARSARLIAERDGKDKFIFSEELKKKAAAEKMETDLEEQRREFTKRLARHRSEQLILNQRIEALKEQIEGLESQKKATARQLEVVQDDLKRKEKLLKRGLTQRSQVTLLQRNEADLLGRLGGYTSEIGRTRTAIVEAIEQKEQLRAKRAETAVTMLNQIHREIADAGEQFNAALSVLKRVVIRAPSAGIVVSLKKNARGSVVAPGEPLIELLPTGSELIVEARVSPLDKDVITVGQPAILRFSSLNQRTTPEVDATVTYVSADRIVDPATREPYFTARLKISENLPGALDRSKIFPGMPVETYIKTGDRTFFEYLVRPIKDSFNKAFLEQ